MDVLLSRLTQQAMQYAIRSGISISTSYALQQCHRLLREAPKGREREELVHMQLRLESKIRILSPSIDMIELIAARGNTSLESALHLTRDIRRDIQMLGVRLSNAANGEHLLGQNRLANTSREATDRELREIVAQIKVLLGRIEDAVPLISLAITTSGVNLSTKLSGTISPSRLLQASAFLTSADANFTNRPLVRQQCGPTYVLTMYMLFAGHASRVADDVGIRESTWKEVIHKAHVKLWRVPLSQIYALPGEAETESTGNFVPAHAKASEFAYQLVVVEDLDDDRVHTYEDGEAQPGPFDDVAVAGIRDVIPIHEVSKIFYADTGKILNISADGDIHNPVVLLKRDVHAEPPRRMLEATQSHGDLAPVPGLKSPAGSIQEELNAQISREADSEALHKPLCQSTAQTMPPSTWRLPRDLDPEWMAFEIFRESDHDDSEIGDDLLNDQASDQSSRSDSLGSEIVSAFTNLKLRSSRSSVPNSARSLSDSAAPLASPVMRSTPAVKTSLSLFEMMMKIAALQQFRQESHLAIEDELLNFFLEDSATAGSGADRDHRQRVRQDALRRVGFDPYDESPIKRRGEEYIQAGRARASPELRHEERTYEELAYDEDYGFNESPRQLPSSSYGPSRPNQQHDLHSSPSPLPRLLPAHQLQTPSRTSTPDTRMETPLEMGHATAAYDARSPAWPSSSPLPARVRRKTKAHSEPRPSPLSRELLEGNV